MKININSQLGLMMDDDNIKVEFLQLMLKRNKELAEACEMIQGVIEKKYDEQILEINSTLEKVKKDEITFTEEDLKEYIEGIPKIESIDLPHLESDRIVKDKVAAALHYTTMNIIDNKNSKLYLICDGVEKCSKMIHMGDNFSSKALRNINFGKHTYLLGKNEVCRFLCNKGAIKGIYWNKPKDIAFEFGFDLENDGYYFDKEYPDEFNKIAKIITFVELGDIEVLLLEKGRNNGKPKKDGKITNDSNFTVYVVDSTWNKLIIRTEGFAVMGHFRLQPCGKDFCDRKLIWIDAFEKHGYKRRPKAEIIRH